MKSLSLSIPTPCHESWDAMTPEDKGRFCASCQKTVMDFTAMSDREIAQFFKKPPGSVCGRFDGSQLNRVVDLPRKRLPWVKYFFSIALPAFLFSKKAGAQGEVKQKLGKVAVCVQPKKSDTATTKLPEPKTVKGVVIDDSGKPIPGVSVLFKNTDRGVRSNDQGEFELKQTSGEEREILISSVGYEQKSMTIDNSGIITLSPSVAGEVVVTRIKKTKQPASVPLMPRKNADTTVGKFLVYPNPVSANSSFNVDTKTLQEGDYTIQVVTVSGDVLQTREISVEKKGRQRLVLRSVNAGVYFIRLTNKKRNESYSKTIVVQ